MVYSPSVPAGVSRMNSEFVAKVIGVQTILHAEMKCPVLINISIDDLGNVRIFNNETGADEFMSVQEFMNEDGHQIAALAMELVE